MINVQQGFQSVLFQIIQTNCRVFHIGNRMSSVFKYCAPKQHYFDILRANQVNCSHPRYLNDRYELADYLIEPYQDFCLAIGWGERHSDLFDNQAIASFNNANVADNLKMWREYAEIGAGFAVEYDKEMMGDALARTYSMPVYIHDVMYIDGHVNLNDVDYSFYDCGVRYSVQNCIKAWKKDGNLMPLDRLLRHLRLTKDQTLWAQESESRIVIGLINQSPHLHKTLFGYNLDLRPGTIKSITLGYNIDNVNRRVIEGIARELSVPVIPFSY